MTTQNWPDPNRPGVPLFSDRDGAHVFENENDEDLHLVYHWNSGKQCWSDFPVNTTKQWNLKPSLQDYKYVGPVLTPAQINKMLAAERERAECAADTRRIEYFDRYKTKAISRWNDNLGRYEWSVQLDKWYPTFRAAIDAAMEGGINIFLALKDEDFWFPR